MDLGKYKIIKMHTLLHTFLYTLTKIYFDFFIIIIVVIIAIIIIFMV